MSPKMSRRAWLRATTYGFGAAAAVDAFAIEPHRLKVERVTLAGDPTLRFAFFTDTHHKGNAKFLRRAVQTINEVAPDWVCFGGDLVERAEYLEEALDIIAEIRAPVYGVPGNWDYWSGVSFDTISKCFEATGGRWLVDESVSILEDSVLIVGRARSLSGPSEPVEAAKRIYLTHYPLSADWISGGPYDIILAGHSHGGQVRVPFYGAVFLPDGVGPYQLGFYETEGGTLYVNPGIGTSQVRARFCCRPEITVFEI